MRHVVLLAVLGLAARGGPDPVDKVRGAGGVTYRFVFAEGCGSATMTEQAERRDVHRLARVDDATKPG